MQAEEQPIESTTATIEQPSTQAEHLEGSAEDTSAAVDWEGVTADEGDFPGGAAEGAGDASTVAPGSEEGAGLSAEEKAAAVPGGEVKVEGKEEPAAKLTPPVAEAATIAPVATKTALTPEEFAAEETRIFGELEKLYTMSDEEAQNFLTEPELVLPKTAARLHMAITKDVIGGIHSVLPGIIQAYMNNTGVEQKARDSFYAKNPDLNNPEYEQYIFKIGKMFREVNPNATSDVAAERIGDMVRQALGIQRQQVAAELVAPTVQSASTLSPKPFMPARGGSGNAPVKEANSWMEIAGDDGLD